MATYFGEVVEPSSRAFWGDDFESEGDGSTKSYKRNKRKLELVNSSNSLLSSKIKLFLVVHGPLATGFVESWLPEVEPVGTIKEIEIEEESIRKQKANTSIIYSLSSDILLCLCSPHLDILQSFDFTEKISPLMKNAEQLIVLTSSYFTEYFATRSQNDYPDAFLRALKTGNFKVPLHSELLEQPNFVKGIPAGVLTWCQIAKVPAALYICYTRSYEIDSKSMKPFVQLFSKLPFKMMREKPNFTHRLFSGPEISSNLYI